MESWKGLGLEGAVKPTQFLSRVTFHCPRLFWNRFNPFVST